MKYKMDSKLRPMIIKDKVAYIYHISWAL
jgi:hypothetical protein